MCCLLLPVLLYAADTAKVAALGSGSRMFF